MLVTRVKPSPNFASFYSHFLQKIRKNCFSLFRIVGERFDVPFVSEPRIFDLICDHPTQNEQPRRIVVQNDVQCDVDDYFEVHVRRGD